MPYQVRRGSGDKPFKIVNKQSGKVVGASKTRNQANASVRARMASEMPVGKAKMGQHRKMMGKRK